MRRPAAAATPPSRGRPIRLARRCVLCGPRRVLAGFGWIPHLRSEPGRRSYDNTSFNARAGTRLGAVRPVCRSLAIEQARRSIRISSCLPSTRTTPTNPPSVGYRCLADSPTWRTDLTRQSSVIDDIEQGSGAFNPSDFTKTDRVTYDWQNTYAPIGGNVEIVGGTHALGGGNVRHHLRPAGLKTSPAPGTYRPTTRQAICRPLAGFGRQRVSARRPVYRSRQRSARRTAGTRNTDSICPAGNAPKLRAPVRGFRAPSSLDLYGFGGNPDLDPEESRNLEFASVTDPGRAVT